MTSLPETLVLYFFVLSILAIYGWHQYPHFTHEKQGKTPTRWQPLAELPRHNPAADLQRM